MGEIRELRVLFIRPNFAIFPGFAQERLTALGSKKYSLTAGLGNRRGQNWEIPGIRCGSVSNPNNLVACRLHLASGCARTFDRSTRCPASVHASPEQSLGWTDPSVWAVS